MNLKRILFLAVPCLLTTMFFFGLDYILDVSREYKMNGADFFTSPIVLESSDVNICGDRTQISIVHRAAKNEMVMYFTAELMSIRPDGNYDIFYELTSALPVTPGEPILRRERNYDTINNGNVPVGTYKWHVASEFKTPTGLTKTYVYESNDFKVYCDRS